MNATPYHIRIAPAAQRKIRTLEMKECKAVIKLIEALAINPRPPGASKIEGMMGLYQESMNHTRIIYKIDDQDILILLVK